MPIPTKHKSKTYSRNICNNSINVLKSFSNPKVYNKYKKYIKKIAKTFTESQTQLISQIENIKKSTNFTIECNHIPLDSNTQIPPFIDIFKYLINNQDFINNFTSSEQLELKHEFGLSRVSSNKSSNKSIYKFLNNSPLGKKLSTQYYNLNSDFKKEISNVFPSIEFHRLLINSFTSYEIIEDLENNIKNLITFSIIWNNKRFENILYVFMYDLDMKRCKSIGNEIIKRLLFFNEFLEGVELPNKFIIFLTNKKKEIDDNVMSQMHFKTININTAVTNGQDIIIYREQELLKSIFHELIHFHNLDFRHIPKSIIDYLLKTHNISSENEYLLYECATETLANILNNIYLSSSRKEFEYNLVKEILFSTLQVVKILKLCGYTKWDEFANSSNHSNSKKQFKQDSCVFSYYILKLYILLNLDTYFKNILDSKMKFIQNDITFKKLIKIFDNARIKDSNLKEIIDTLLQNMDHTNHTNHTHHTNHNKKYTKSTMKNNSYLNKKRYAKINKTLRMTCLESNLFSKNSI